MKLFVEKQFDDIKRIEDKNDVISDANKESIKNKLRKDNIKIAFAGVSKSKAIWPVLMEKV